LTIKIHALVDALGNPVEVMLSAGQDHALTCAHPLIEAVDPGALIADKAFDADPFIAAFNDRAIAPVIPSKSNRITPRAWDFAPSTANAISHRAFLQSAQEFPGHRRAHDKLAQTFSPAFNSYATILHRTQRRASTTTPSAPRFTGLWLLKRLGEPVE
jgi:transposase